MEDNIKILNDLKMHLKKHLGDEVKNVILFGSQKSNKAGIDSDYDLLIILKTKPNWRTRNKISDLCYDIALKYDIIPDTHILGESEINSLRGRQSIFKNALKNGIYA